MYPRVMSSVSDSAEQVAATFVIDLKPGVADIDGTARFDFTKSWVGGMEGVSRGQMLSAGDPSLGNAGYIAIEMFEGTIAGRRGKVAMQQFGTMRAGEYVLRYELAPGSGTNELAGIVGGIDLTIVDGKHEVILRYEV